MDDRTRRLLGIGALLAPVVHSLTDILEWIQTGFSGPQLWLNYLAFLPVPAVMLGLYAAQRPTISRMGLAGALMYGIAFIYFAHTTLVALADGVATYEELWMRLGATYSAHGAIMVAGGALFGLATARAGELPRWTAWLFLAGIGLNLGLFFVPLPDLFQTLGTAILNTGLAGMGWAILRQPRRIPAVHGKQA